MYQNKPSQLRAKGNGGSSLEPRFSLGLITTYDVLSTFEPITPSSCVLKRRLGILKE